MTDSPKTTPGILIAMLFATVLFAGCQSAQMRPEGALPIARDMDTPQMRSIPMQQMPGQGQYPAMYGGGQYPGMAGGGR